MPSQLLNSKEIRLRAIEPEDLEHFYRWENDTTLWSTGTNVAPISRFALRQYIESTLSADLYTSHDLRLVIERISDKQVIGSADLYDIDHHHRRATIGILIDPQFQQQGYGKVALEELKIYATQFLSIENLHGYISVNNNHSTKLFLNAGFTISGTLKRWIRIGNEYEDVNIIQYLATKQGE